MGPTLFLLHFNDLGDCLKHDEVIQFADDTVIYVSDKCFVTIQRKLNEDLQSVSRYFKENELIINLKKGKSEFMLLGTNKRLSKCPDQLSCITPTT